MGLSIRAYARQRGVSDAAVRKAIQSGRITAEADGTIDPARADRDWQQHTQAHLRRRGEGPTFDTGAREATGSGGATLVQARTANEVLKAQHHKLKLAKLKGELIDRAAALAHVFALARSERDAWLNWPTRIAAVLAAELGVDAHTMHVVLEREVRAHLDELGDMKARVD